MDSWTLKRHNTFQNKNNGKAPHSFAPRPLIFKLKQEVWKYSDVCMSLGSPKKALETNEFQARHFYSIVLNNLFISFNNLFISLTELKDTH